MEFVHELLGLSEPTQTTLTPTLSIAARARLLGLPRKYRTTMETCSRCSAIEADSSWVRAWRAVQLNSPSLWREEEVVMQG